jgi:hypothetical protein
MDEAMLLDRPSPPASAAAGLLAAVKAFVACKGQFTTSCRYGRKGRR